MTDNKCPKCKAELTFCNSNPEIFDGYYYCLPCSTIYPSNYKETYKKQESPTDTAFNAGRIYGLREAYDVVLAEWIESPFCKADNKDTEAFDVICDKILELINKETHE